MTVDKLPEFAKNGQRNTDNLNQEDGFPVNLKPARQWFNFLFNQLALSINQIIDEKLNKTGGEISGELRVNNTLTLGLRNGEKLKPVTRITIVPPTHTGLWNQTINDDETLSYYQIRYNSFIAFQIDNIGNAKVTKLNADEVTASLNGNAATASKLQVARNIALSGAVSGNAGFDGSGNIVINAALNNFSSYKAENGYKYLGDGTILQWGRIDSDATEKNVTVTFPITFPNGCLNISMTRLSAYSTSATSEADGDALVVEGTITNYSFVANLQRFNTSTSMLKGAMWFAIGH